MILFLNKIKIEILKNEASCQTKLFFGIILFPISLFM